ncbi:putative 1-acylglycerol-3-phosphate O-acyltransferase [Chlorella sorokiniana]|uniref:1-acylglycerol-3-phosphate O-acyltransferase n=1 Tax=Chlorella sorokiniana TaxID=3076 RepID=A0A2P6TXC9_CHLSO|nr:putative 1-acylglycerol-3-phosphate O-acyltransferase [Chlorella sorokiniana]|eukprot:PRW58725.1 putative 1-acylglycerol-3-phosphate O-acyltransferase [Chlorella sorokiniana]
MRWRPTSHDEGVYYERKLLDMLRNTYEARDVRVGPGKEEFVHTVTSGLHNTDSPAFVAIPGYSTGSSFLFKLFDGLSSAFRLYAIDLLGTGLSGRPPFRVRNREEAERFFVDSLDTWRQEQGLDKMVLMGHSMGGYLSACYALRHPERVQHLILMCPAGVGGKPADWQIPAILRDPWTWRGMLFRFATRVWEWGVTPGSIVRCWGPWGPGLTKKYCRSRFTRQQQLTDAEVEVFEIYHYHTLGKTGSGEFALRHILEPFAWPRAPLEERMAELDVPITFIYGEHDWMDAKAGRRVVAALSKQRAAAHPGDLKVMITPDAGHYPAIDQPRGVLLQLADACGSYLPAAAREALLAEAGRQLPHAAVQSDSKEELEREMGRNPLEAAAHEASEL